jgi:hypothetical protein
VLTLNLFLPESQSLKAKRSLLRPLVENLRSRHNVSVAETGHLDAWQRATLTVAAVSGEETRVREVLDAIVRLVEERHGLHLLDHSVEMV